MSNKEVSGSEIRLTISTILVLGALLLGNPYAGVDMVHWMQKKAVRIGDFVKVPRKPDMPRYPAPPIVYHDGRYLRYIRGMSSVAGRHWYWAELDGTLADYVSTGYYNVAIGQQAWTTVETGHDNVYIGPQVAEKENVAIGRIWREE